MKDTDTTQSELLKLQATRLKLSVCDLLKWTELEFANFQYQQGLNYIGSLCVSPELADAMERNRLFWNWWKNQWTVLDDDFVRASQWLKHDPQLMYAVYLEMHDGRMLSGKLLPHSIVMISITKEDTAVL